MKEKKCSECIHHRVSESKITTCEEGRQIGTAKTCDKYNDDVWDIPIGRPHAKPLQRRDTHCEYPIVIYSIPDGERYYYYAYHPDFGSSACSATGDSIVEVVTNLEKVRTQITQYYKEVKKEIPVPTVCDPANEAPPSLISTGPGSVIHRFDRIMEELEKLFPLPHSRFPEVTLLKKLNALIESSSDIRRKAEALVKWFAEKYPEAVETKALRVPEELVDLCKALGTRIAEDTVAYLEDVKCRALGVPKEYLKADCWKDRYVGQELRFNYPPCSRCGGKQIRTSSTIANPMCPNCLEHPPEPFSVPK